MEKINLQKILALGDWKEMTTKLLIEGKYDIKLELPHYVYENILSDDLKKAEAAIYYLEKNLDFLDGVGSNYNHLLEYQSEMGENLTKELCEKSTNVLKKYYEFLKENLKHQEHDVFYKNNKYDHSISRLIYYDNYRNLYKKYIDIHKKNNKTVTKKSNWAD